MKISAINNYHFNSLSFEAKNKKNTQQPAHSTSTIKAVPVAMLIAMSPLNAPAAVAQAPTTESSYSQPEENEVVAQSLFNDATPEGTSALITVRSADGNKKVVELRMSQKLDSYAMDKDGNVVNAYRVREIEIVPEKLYSRVETKNYANSGQKVEAKYYVIGSGTECTYPPQTLDKSVSLNENAQPIISKATGARYEISKRLYYHLKNMLRDNIDINEEHSSTFIIDGKRK